MRFLFISTVVFFIYTTHAQQQQNQPVHQQTQQLVHQQSQQLPPKSIYVQPSQQLFRLTNRPVQHGYITNQRIITNGVANYGGGSFISGGIPTLDYNPSLSGGSRGYPGIKARLNQRSFQYFSTLVAPIIDREIKRARIPPISQCVPQVNGCIQVYNLYVSRYRCPQRFVIYPASPNKIVIAVQNVDVGVTGNLGGQINILVPIALFGIIQVNAHQVSITVELAISRGPTGAPYVQVVGCTATVGYLDACIENGGLIGDIANSQFRSQISNQVRSMVPNQLCSQIPQIVNEKINGQLGNLPQTLSLTQMLQIAGGALGLAGSGSGQCSPSCNVGTKGPAASSFPLPQTPKAPKIPKASAPPLPPPSPEKGSSGPPSQTVAPPPFDPPPSPSYAPSASQQPKAQPLPSSPYAQKHVKVVASGAIQTIHKPISNTLLINSDSSGDRLIVANRFVRDTHAVKQPVPSTTTVKTVAIAAPNRSRAYGSSGIVYPQNPPISNSGSSGGIQFPPPGSGCGGCPGANSDTFSQLKEITKYLDISKLNDIFLTVQLLQTYATSNDYTIDLSGEFSQGGQGGTPFGPFPMQFPYPVGHKMAEIMISDYTINSLFYSLHRKNFLSVRLGPDTPKIGSLLKTTCSDDEDEGLEDHGVELDEESKKMSVTRSRKSKFALFHRVKRQNEESGGLADLGICLGDLLPAAREKYPNQNIIVNVRTYRAPSVVLSSRNGGTAILDIIADANLSTEKGESIGTIRVEATFEIIIRTTGSGINGHGEIKHLKLTNPDQQLGLTQEALDNLGNLGKELVQKAANDILEKGIPISIPSGGIGGLPLNFISPEFHIVEHGIHIESDFTISPSFLDQLSGGGGGGYGGVCRR